eukprot:7949444-Heterocapsa_arctica.AAC.1
MTGQRLRGSIRRWRSPPHRRPPALATAAHSIAPSRLAAMTTIVPSSVAQISSFCAAELFVGTAEDDEIVCGLAEEI